MTPRLTARAVLFSLSVLFVVCQAEPVVAQGKDAKKDVNQLERQLKAAQGDLLQAERQIAALKQNVAQLQTAKTKLEAAKKKDDNKKLKTLQTTIDGYRGAGLVHVVVLKAKPDTTDSDVQNTIDESYAQLSKIKTVRGLWAGKPASKATPD